MKEQVYLFFHEIIGRVRRHEREERQLGVRMSSGNARARSAEHSTIIIKKRNAKNVVKLTHSCRQMQNKFTCSFMKSLDG